MIARTPAALGVDVVTGLVVASVAVALAGLSWRLAGGGDEALPTAAAPPLAAPGPADLTAVNALSPFGRPAPTVAGPSGSGLQLRGVMMTVPVSASSVLISPSGGTPVAYRIGEAVPGGGTIETIAINHVVLNVGGRSEMLSFPRRAGANGVVSAAAINPAPSIPANVAPAPMVEAVAVAPAQTSGAPQSFLDTMGATAANGGYRVGPNAAANLRQAGLMPGDVIERVNGSTVGNAERDRALFGAAALAGSARVDIVRNGQRMTLTVPLR